MMRFGFRKAVRGAQRPGELGVGEAAVLGFGDFFDEAWILLYDPVAVVAAVKQYAVDGSRSGGMSCLLSADRSVRLTGGASGTLSDTTSGTMSGTSSRLADGGRWVGDLGGEGGCAAFEEATDDDESVAWV